MRELEVSVGRQRFRTRVASFERYVDHVAVALEGVVLLHVRRMAPLGREPQFQAVSARRERALAWEYAPGRAMVGRRVPREAALRLIAVLGTEEHQVLAAVLRVLVPQQLEAFERAAEGIDLGDDEIGADAHDLTLGGGFGRRHAGHRRLPCIWRRRLWRARHGLLRGRWRRGLRPVLSLPSLPEHE